MAAPAVNSEAKTDANMVPLDALARHHAASRLPLATAMYLGANIARAVAEAHDQGRVLGTLDANRIRCSHDGRVVIAPDGGTMMAPETKRGEPPDVLSDIYAVGAIVYRLLTGMTPLQAMTRQPVSRLHEVPAPSSLIPGVDPALDDVLLSALANDPGERPISARVLSNTIEAIFTELELIASPSGVVRAVAATDSKRMTRLPLVPSETASTVTTALNLVEAPTGSLGSIIVSPSLMAPAIPHESPTIETSPGSTLVEETREVSPPQNLTVLERPSRVSEAPTQSLGQPGTSLIYGHPFFRKQEELSDDDVQEENISAEATSDVVPFDETLTQARRHARFAGEVWVDARQRLARKWRRASPAGRAWSVVAAAGSVAVVLLAVLLSGRGDDGRVEVLGEPKIAVNKPRVSAPAAVSAPVAAATPVVAVAKAPLAQAAPVVPARPAVKVAAPAPTVSKAGKLSKKQLAAKKKAAKRAALARRHVR